MFRLGTGSFIVICVIIGLCGCGGGSGGNDTSTTVAIQQFQVFNHPDEFRIKFFPKTTTIPAGVNSRIQWVNQTPGRHQIVSGILTSQGNPAVKHLIVINLGFFSPDELSVDAGDTIQFSNLSGRAFTLQIVDTDGTVRSSVTIPIGGTAEPPQLKFPGPGVWIVQDPDSQQIATVTLFGHPVPDGRFMSGVMSHGNVFQAAFPIPGNFPYFDSNPDDPTHVYANGTIVVQ